MFRASELPGATVVGRVPVPIAWPAVCAACPAAFSDRLFWAACCASFLPSRSAAPAVDSVREETVCFDCTVSIIALVISLVYFRQFHGIREGTVIAAIGVGKILSLYAPLRPTLHRFMYAAKAE